MSLNVFSNRAGLLLAVIFSAAAFAATPKVDLTKAKHLELCRLVRHGNAAALNELVRRKTFAANEISYIASATLFIGMTEGAVACALGPAERMNTTHTAAGEDKQVILANDRYLYFTNGRLTAWQD